MPPARHRYHVWYGVPQFIRELGVKEPKETRESQFYWSVYTNPVLDDIRARSLKQRQRKRRNRNG